MVSGVLMRHEQVIGFGARGGGGGGGGNRYVPGLSRGGSFVVIVASVMVLGDSGSQCDID